MKHTHIKAIISIVAFFAIPFSVIAEVTEVEKTNSICAATMAHDSLSVEFISNDLTPVRAGSDIIRDIKITNKTAAVYKNTQILSKVFFYDEKSVNSKSNDKFGKLIDVSLLPALYDIGGGSTATATIKWKSTENMASGLYRIDLYIVQNGIHVIGDFARVGSADSSSLFKLEGAGENYPVSISLSKTLVGDRPYAVDKMMLFKADQKIDTAYVSINNSSNKQIEAKLSWKVFPYGKFDNKEAFIIKNISVTLKAKGETVIPLDLPLVPSNRYLAIADVEYDGQHRVEMMRFAKWEVVPAAVDTFGIFKDGDVFSTTSTSPLFALKKGEKYKAFVCLVGGYTKAPTTVTMRLRDDKNNVIFSQEETQQTNIGTAAYEYSFIPTEFTDNFKLEITAVTGEHTVKTTWVNNCSKSDSLDCKNPSFLANLPLKYIFPTVIIIALFTIFYFIKNNKLHKLHHEK